MKKTESTAYIILIITIIFITMFGKDRSTKPQKLKSVAVLAILDHVYDGDTIYCNVKEWPPILGKNIGVRLNGIDTPEMHDKRPHIKFLANEAKAELLKNLGTSKFVELRNIQRGKYFRIIADVYVGGMNMSDVLLDAHLAKEYDGDTKTQWVETDYDEYMKHQNKK